MITDQIVSHPASHAGCLMCGEQNSMSFKLEFRAAPDGSVYADFEPFPELQGYEGQMHGGIICSLLDSSMVHCLFHRNIEAVTAELTVKFNKPVPYNSVIRLRAWISGNILTLYKVNSELLVNGEILASAESKFMGMKK